MELDVVRFKTSMTKTVYLYDFIILIAIFLLIWRA